MTEILYRTSPVKRVRRTKAELADLEAAIYTVAAAEQPLTTRPTKQSDSRAPGFEGESVEVDALRSPVLRGIVRDAIERWIDPATLRLTKAVEASEREVLERIAGGWETSA